MITRADYFKAYADHPGITPEMEASADALLERVNALCAEAQAAGVVLETNPLTGTNVSGEFNGGWRPRECNVGATMSSHKQARAVDIYDPRNALDAWITDAILAKHGLYREAPSATISWCHLTDRAPGSGRRTFNP